MLSKTLAWRMLVACLVPMLMTGGCTRERPVTPTAVPESPPAVTEAVPTPAPSPTPTEPPVTYYTVQTGDTLWSIAIQFGITVQSLTQANEIANPDRLQPGQQLVIPLSPGEPAEEACLEPPCAEDEPETTSPTVHTVKEGDNLWSIALQYGTTVGEIVELNGGEADRLLQIGEELLIP